MPDLARIVRQHAETSRLLGVDFVPVSTRRGAKTVAPKEQPGQGSAGKEQAAREQPMPRGRPRAEPARAGAELPVAGAQAAAPKAAPSVFVPAKNAKEKAARLDALRARYEAEAPHAQFVTAHTNIVFGDGDPGTSLVFVGEAPGEEEDRLGKPFVGRSGQLLTKMIAGMGLSREQVYICNVLKTRPPNNATPTGREIELCEPYLREQLSIIAPKVIVTLGLPASRAVLKSDESMTRMRGRWRTYSLLDGSNADVMPTYHPAYVLRNYTEETRRLVWSDLQQVQAKLGIQPSKSGEAKAGA